MASAQEWAGIGYGVEGEHEVVTLNFSKDVPPPHMLHIDQGAARIVLDWDVLSVDDTLGKDIGGGQKAVSGQGAVSQFRYARRGETGLRIVLDLDPEAKFSSIQSLGHFLNLSFKAVNQELSAATAFSDSEPLHNSFAYSVPIPRLKSPSSNLLTAHVVTLPQSDEVLVASLSKPSLGALPSHLPVTRSPVTQPTAARPSESDDQFAYSVPFPRLKPSSLSKLSSGSPSLGYSGAAALVGPSPSLKKPEISQKSTRELYNPSKRVFISGETVYPRLAPHLGLSAGAERTINSRSAALTPPPQRPPLQKTKSSKPVIVIDPGHGGYDPGAIGANGTKEKVITSAVTKRLASALKRTGRYEVVITRTRDVYVEHDDRLRIARERGGDLFISLHADATANGRASGASVYTLSDRSKGRSKKITHTQNWILDVDLSEQTASVGDILVDLAQRKTLSQSAEFAALLVRELKAKVPLVRNTHRRAGYYVLLAPDVPAVLLELGFISNAADERRLNQASEQEKIVKGVTRAINSYFDAKKP